MEQNCLNDSGDSKRGKRNTRSQSKKNAIKSENESQASFELFIPNDIPTILDSKENEDSKAVRQPMSAGKISLRQSFRWHHQNP